MFENLFISLILMAVSGVTFVAYKHPELYENAFSGKLVGTSIVIIVGGMVWDSGASDAFQTLLPLIDKEKIDESQKLLEGVSTHEYVYGIAFAVIAYSMFLSWLADHFKKQEKLAKD